MIDLDDSLRAVAFVAVRCPRCNAAKPRTYGQRGRVRYHKCQQCGTKYRSIEMPLDEARTFHVPGCQRDADAPR